MELEKYSFGLGDRFGLQGKALLQAIIEAKHLGVHLTPVWNKSFREHAIVGSSPAHTRGEADEAVRDLRWQAAYFVDADHITRHNVGLFIEHSDFFTIDVADYLDKPPDPTDLTRFIQQHAEYSGQLRIPGLEETFEVEQGRLAEIGRRYLAAIHEAQRVYELIRAQKHGSPFVVELSMDEAAQPLEPVELFFILAEVAVRGLPISTVAPKFIGRLNKGVDYEGDLEAFTSNFNRILAVLRFAKEQFPLRPDLKLSVHSGSDKFSLYGPIGRLLRRTGMGLHIKTAGTTWLEELAGLAEGGEEGLALAKDIYRQAYQRLAELVVPYAAVVEIHPARLPHPDEVARWGQKDFVVALEHRPSNPRYKRDFRQLLHLAYKVAAEAGTRYTELVLKYRDIISDRVTRNILERHIRPLFLGD
ncbi:MAG: tagaturonate epimerase family protein [Candidatus Zipacnadales bacterium]